MPLLVLGTGSHDGGYFFEGELILLDLVHGERRQLFADDHGREVRSLEWADSHTLRLHLAPPDDWEGRTAWTESHRAEITRPDWRSLPAHSVRHEDVTNPRVPAPLPSPADTSEPDGPQPGEIRSLTVLPDGDILLTADHVLLERWTPEGERRWSVPATADLAGGRLAAVATDGTSAWVEAIDHRLRDKGEFLRINLTDGRELDRHTAPGRPHSPRPPPALYSCRSPPDAEKAFLLLGHLSAPGQLTHSGRRSEECCSRPSHWPRLRGGSPPSPQPHPHEPVLAKL